MKKKAKYTLAIGIGCGIGAVTFPLLRGAEIDWQQSVFMVAVAVLVFLALPTRLIDRMPPREKKNRFSQPS